MMAYDAITNSKATTNTDAKTEDNQGYFVRVQAQGKELSKEIHIPIPSDKPVTAKQAIAALSLAEAQLTNRDRKQLGDAFKKAEAWINRVSEAGGVPPIGNVPFTKRGVSPNDARVDVDVMRGPVNLVNQ